MDASILLWAPIALLFLSAIINAVVKRRSRDICLSEFNGDVVLIEMKDGSIVQGALRVFPDSMEITYTTPPPAKDTQFVRQTLVLPKPRIEQIQCLYRLAPDEMSAQREAWTRELRALRRPSLWRRAKRSIRNAYNILRDAFSQSIGLLIGIFKTRNKTMGSLQTADQRATEVGQTILSALPNAYEPILEKYIGAQVVTQTMKNNVLVEEIGVLQDYTLQYLLIRDVKLSEPPASLNDASAAENGRRPTVDLIYPRTAAWVQHKVIPAREPLGEQVLAVN
jgi:hypothetical protein